MPVWGKGIMVWSREETSFSCELDNYQSTWGLQPNDQVDYIFALVQAFPSYLESTIYTAFLGLMPRFNGLSHMQDELWVELVIQLLSYCHERAPSYFSLQGFNEIQS